MGGGFIDLWPDGAADAPWDLVLAVNQALMVISWHENLPTDEQPPRHIWWSDELLDGWFRNVRQRREDKYGGGRSKSSYLDAEDVPMTNNELADQFRPVG